MKKLFSNALVVSAIAATLFGCRKDEMVSTPIDNNPNKIVKQVSSSPTDFVSYEYEAAGNVIKHVSQWQNGTGSVNKLTSVYEYSSGKLVRWSNEAGHALYSYKNDVVEKAENFSINGKKLSTMLFKFSNGKLTEVIEQIENAKPGDVKETQITYAYESNGNVRRIDFAHRKELTDPFTINFSKVFVEYDDKKNPEPDGVIGFFVPGVVLHINNPLKVENFSNNVFEGYSRYEYSYNADGLPTQRKQFIAVGSTEQPPIVFQYTY